MNKAKELVKSVPRYWSNPPEGSFMPFKEIIAYSIGGLGAYFIFSMAQQLLLSTTNVIIGNTIGIKPMHMYVMYLISVITNIPLTALRANMIDNVRHKEGKYRPFILRMGIPTVIVSLLYVYTPYDKISYFQRCAFIFLYNFLLQFFYNFFYDSYENLIHVLSPNTQERTNVTAIKSVIYSLAPTITNFVIPLIAERVSDGNIYDLKVYRVLYPFIAVGGIALSILVYVNTSEKIVQAKTHEAKIYFVDALRAVAKNKYFWIISLAGWIGFLEGAANSILQWLYTYGKLCTSAQYSVITLVHGNASLWGMLLCPFLIKRWGKKKVLVVTNLFNILFIALVYPSMHNIWVVLIFMYLNAMMNSFAVILNPNIQADIRDYQQFRTGERIDGMFAAVGLIGSFVTMATSSVLPACYEKYGIFEGNGYENMYDILFDTDILFNLVGVLIILSVVGAALNVIPFFFYDLSELKQQKMIKILKIRAVFEDYSNNAASPHEMRATLDMIKESRELVAAGRADIDNIKAQSRACRDKQQKNALKKELKAAKEQNEKYEIALAVIEEIENSAGEGMKIKYEYAKKIADAGLEGITDYDESELKCALSLPNATEKEKNLRREMCDMAKTRRYCAKTAKKKFPGGVTEFDTSVLDEVYAKEAALDEEQFRLNKELAEAKKENNTAECRRLKNEIKTSENRRYVISGEIKKAQNAGADYHSCAKSYLDAVRLINRADCYARIDAIAAEYE